MNISEESKYFWSILETELGLQVPEHIQNILRIYGVDNALTFKIITEDTLNDIQQFVRHDLSHLLQLDSITETEDLHRYFGSFVSATEEFVFSSEERQNIIKCVKHIQYKVDLNGINSNLAHFRIDECTDDTTDLQSASDQTPEIGSQEIIHQTQTHIILRKLLNTADQNAIRKKEGYRFGADVKDLALILRVYGGPYLYETVQKNLEICLPSLSATNRYIRQRNKNIIEGVLRAHELAEYLRSRNLSPFVALSEDATRITGTVQYDARNNQLIGFVLPLNFGTGMPIPFSFKARDADEILTHFVSQRPIAQYVNVIMAQPLDHVPPFCLLIYGSDNKYSAENVADRWQFISEQLQKEGVTVVTISSDSDPKFNSAMKNISKLGQSSNIFIGKNWFSCGTIIRLPFCVQDHIHIATKLRNLMLKTLNSPKLLPFGKKCYISIEHLQYLMNNFTKDQHLLTESTINPEDRQNYSSVQRMCSDKVINLLKRHVRNSVGTSTFLTLIRDIVDSYVSVDLLPLERVKKIWYALFVIRLWREYIKKHPKHMVTQNFMSTYSYSCIELNAHSLVLIILYLKEKNESQLFTPWLFSSQVCEEMFRQIRSFTTVYSTVANCSIKEVIGRIDKIQQQSDMALNSMFVFPRFKKPNSTSERPHLPSKEEICEVIEECKAKAIHFAKEAGLMQSSSTSLTSSVTVYKAREWYDVFEESDDISLPSFGHIDLRDYSNHIDVESIHETSGYVKLTCVDKTMVVKKTSLCWFLREDTYKLSSDRLVRVRSRIDSKKKTPKGTKRKLKKTTKHSDK